MQEIGLFTHLEALEAGGDLPLEAVEDVVGMTGLTNHNQIKTFKVHSSHLLVHVEDVDFNPIGGEVEQVLVVEDDGKVLTTKFEWD